MERGGECKEKERGRGRKDKRKAEQGERRGGKREEEMGRRKREEEAEEGGSILSTASLGLNTQRKFSSGCYRGTVREELQATGWPEWCTRRLKHSASSAGN